MSCAALRTIRSRGPGRALDVVMTYVIARSARPCYTCLMTVVIATGFHVTPLQPGDGPALLALHERCSPATRFRRWHGHLTQFPRRYLAELLAATDSASAPQLGVAAWSGAGTMIGFASAALLDPGVRELGVLVHDDWQGRGVGRTLVTALAEQARAAGTTVLCADVLAGDAALVESLRRLGPTVSRVKAGSIAAEVLLRG